jgi:hypothetical protein
MALPTWLIVLITILIILAIFALVGLNVDVN